MSAPPPPVWKVQIQPGGHVKARDKDRLTGYLAALAGTEGIDGEAVFRKVRKTRSTQANRYYFGVVVAIIADYCGCEVDEMHEILAMKFLRIEDDPILNVPRRRRTPETSSSEFSDYVDQCKRLGAGLGLYIPDAGEVDL